jgi:O-antigen/teichoic acid export membrane protein
MNLLPAFIMRRIAHRPNLEKIIENVSWLFVDKVFHLVVGLIVGVWVARYLGPSQYGVINFATAFVALFAIFSSLGLQNIAVRDLVKNPEDTETTLGTAAVLHLLGSMIAFGLVVWAVQMLRPDDDVARWAVIIFGAGMVFNTSAISKYWFEAHVLSKYTVWITTSTFLATSAVKIVLILMEAPLIAFVWATFANTGLVGLGMLVVLVLRGVDLRRLKFRLGRAQELLRDSWPLILAGLAVAVYMKIDMVMLGMMLDDHAVGIYGAATRLSEPWYFIPMIIVASVFPAILEAKKQNEVLYYSRLQRLYDLMVILSVAGAVVMTFVSGPLVNLLFGAAYAQSGQVLAVHIWASVFVFLGVASGKWFIAENRQILTLYRTVAGAIVNIALNYVLIPIYGPLGAAWATVVSYSVSAFLSDIFLGETRPMFMMKLKSINLYKGMRRITGEYE